MLPSAGGAPWDAEYMHGVTIPGVKDPLGFDLWNTNIFERTQRAAFSQDVETLFRELDMVYTIYFRTQNKPDELMKKLNKKNEEILEKLNEIKQKGKKRIKYPKWFDEAYKKRDTVQNSVPFISAEFQDAYKESKYMSTLILETEIKPPYKEFLTDFLKDLEYEIKDGGLLNKDKEKTIKFKYDKDEYEFKIKIGNTRDYLEIYDPSFLFNIKIKKDSQDNLYCYLSYLNWWNRTYYKYLDEEQKKYLKNIPIYICVYFITTLSFIIGCKYIKLQDLSSKKSEPDTETVYESWALYLFQKYTLGRNYYTKYGFFSYPKPEKNLIEDDLKKECQYELDDYATIMNFELFDNKESAQEFFKNIFFKPVVNKRIFAYANFPNTIKALLDFWIIILSLKSKEMTVSLNKDQIGEYFSQMDVNESRNILKSQSNSLTKKEIGNILKALEEFVTSDFIFDAVKTKNPKLKIDRQFFKQPEHFHFYSYIGKSHEVKFFDLCQLQNEKTDPCLAAFKTYEVNINKKPGDDIKIILTPQINPNDDDSHPPELFTNQGPILIEIEDEPETESQQTEDGYETEPKTDSQPGGEDNIGKPTLRRTVTPQDQMMQDMKRLISNPENTGPKSKDEPEDTESGSDGETSKDLEEPDRDQLVFEVTKDDLIVFLFKYEKKDKVNELFANVQDKFDFDYALNPQTSPQIKVEFQKKIQKIVVKASKPIEKNVIIGFYGGVDLKRSLDNLDAGVKEKIKRLQDTREKKLEEHPTKSNEPRKQHFYNEGSPNNVLDVLDYKDGNEKPDLEDTEEIITYKLGAGFENNSTFIVKLSDEQKIALEYYESEIGLKEVVKGVVHWTALVRDAINPEDNNVKLVNGYLVTTKKILTNTQICRYGGRGRVKNAHEDVLMPWQSELIRDNERNSEVMKKINNDVNFLEMKEALYEYLKRKHMETGVQETPSQPQAQIMDHFLSQLPK